MVQISCPMTLTPVDRIILKSYETMIDGLSDYLGNGCEIVLHSLEDINHSVIKIVNGYHTGRSLGAPITDLALKMLNTIKGSSDEKLYMSYFTRNRKNEPMKSSTIAIMGENRRIIGLMCINFYMNIPMSYVIDFLSPHYSQISSELPESFSKDIDDILGVVVCQTRDRIYLDNTIPASKKNKAIISELYYKGVFNFKDSVVHIADLLCISKNTVYLHIKSARCADNI